MRELILASTSPWRRRILENAGVRIRTVPSEVDESKCAEADPVQHALVLARWKAEAVSRQYPQLHVLGSDQVMWDGERVHGKPTDPDAHVEMLKALRGKDHWLYTGYCIVGPSMRDSDERDAHQCREEKVVETRLRIRGTLTDEEICAYVHTGEGSQCAGGYAIEGHGAWLFEEVQGDWFNIVGLPLFDVLESLRRLGWVYGA